MTLEPPKFRPHGASEFEVRGQVLVLTSQGPFNAEHIQSLAPRFREYGAALQQTGPWATINVVTKSVLSTPEGIEMLRRSAQWTHDHLGRVAAAYVVAREVEGRLIMLPEIRRSCDGIMPIEFFEQFEPAEAWALARISEAVRGS
jgi:hypothetical protein